MDDTDPARVANLRDVGSFVNLIAGRVLLPEGRLLRGGTIHGIRDLAVVGRPRTVINLKNGIHPDRDGVATLHHPRPDTAECYQTGTKGVRAWLRGILRSLAEPPAMAPLYVHCHSGLDRTGVVVAALLKIIDVPDAVIIEEYMLSEGARLDRVREALAGLQAIDLSLPDRHRLPVRAMLLG